MKGSGGDEVKRGGGWRKGSRGDEVRKKERSERCDNAWCP